MMTSTRARSQAKKPSATPIVVAVVIGLVLVAGVIAFLGIRSSDEGAGDSPAYGEVAVSGDALPTFAAGQTDPTVGQAAPTVTGTDFSGAAVSLEANGEPTVILFLAHWCPHCQREVPVVQEWLDAGGLPEGTRLLSVATSTDPTRPNFPPADWLEREGWTAPVLVDDEQSTAGTAFGLSGFPFWVFLDGDGKVVGRASGEVDPEQVGQVLSDIAGQG